MTSLGIVFSVGYFLQSVSVELRFLGVRHLALYVHALLFPRQW